MDKQNYLLVCLLEECAEVQKAITKTLRFGLEDTKPNTNTTNKELIEDELSDIQGIIELLKEECGVEIKTSINTILEKKKRVRRYMDYSRKSGFLSD